VRFLTACGSSPRYRGRQRRSYDPTVVAGRVVEHPYIVITDGRISSISSKDTAVAPGARHIELPGITLLPGLIDMHVHLTSDPHYGGDRELEFTDNFWTVVGTANARRTLEAGFTTVRNVGSRNFDGALP
jgi:imidazolonepropionase-like amidohydrolase